MCECDTHLPTHAGQHARGRNRRLHPGDAGAVDLTKCQGREEPLLCGLGRSLVRLVHKHLVMEEGRNEEGRNEEGGWGGVVTAFQRWCG